VNTDNPENQNGLPEKSEQPEQGPENPETEISETPSPTVEESSASLADAEKPEQPAAQSEKVEVPVPAAENKKGRGGGFLTFLAFVFALVALAGTTWMWWQDQQVVDASESRVVTEISRLESTDSELALKIRQVQDQVENLPSSDNSAEIAALERRLQGDVDELDRLKQSMTEQLSMSRSLQMAGESLQRRLSAAETALTGVASRELDAGGELDLAEVDYLLRLANERLKLFNDPVAADETLELADIHLAAMDDPIYLGVRQDIAVARRDLASLELPDFFAISNQLDSVQASIAGLPFRGQEAVPVETAEVGEGWWDKLKGVFSGLVTVRRSTELEDQRISLEDKDYVRQRLWLQLEIAHLALMRRDQAAFGSSLARVRETVSTWFEESSDSYGNIMQQIGSLEAMNVQLVLPDISKPWSTLRQVRTLRTRPTAAPPPPAEDQAEPVAPLTEPVEEEPAPEDEQG